MNLLKCFSLIVMAWFLSIIANAEETNTCEAPQMKNNREIEMGCIFINGESYKGTLVPKKGLGEWEVKDFEPKECNFDIDKCVTVSGTSDQIGDIKFAKLPNLTYEDGTNSQQIIILSKDSKFFSPEQPNNLSPDNNLDNNKPEITLFKAAKAFNYQTGISKSYGTLRPLPKLGEKLPKLPVDSVKKKLIAIYMVGSDLEQANGNNQESLCNDTQEPKGLGTTDLKELMTGYRSLNSKEEIDIVVAYGGSDKTVKFDPNGADPNNCSAELRWKGVRFAKFFDKRKNDGRYQFSNLLKDNDDESFYFYEEEHANMGDKSTLRHFLNFLQKDPLFYEYKSKMLFFWGHGGSYRGFGNDQVYSMDGLSLPEMQAAFEEAFEKDQSKKIFDLIGFDACLMGSVEVANIFEPYAKYLLASEDLESGEGWNWENVIRNADTNHDDVTGDNLNIERFARAIVNDYSSVKTDDVPGGFSKTLSVVNLDKLKMVKEKFNAVASTAAIALQSEEKSALRNAFFNAAIEASGYGKRGQKSSDDRISIDWKNFAQIAKKNVNTGSVIETLNDFIHAFDEYVIYSSHNNEYANGVSFGGLEETAPLLSGAAGDLRQAFLAVKNSDKIPPKITSPREASAKDLFEVPYIQGGIFGEVKKGSTTKRGKQQTEMLPFLNGERSNFVYLESPNLRSLLSLDDVKGIAARFEDDVYVAQVTTLFAEKKDTRCVENCKYQVIAELEAYATEIDNFYFTPYWNKQWYTVQYEEEENKYIEIPLAFQYRYRGTDEGWYTYYATKIDFVDASLKNTAPPNEQLEDFKSKLETVKNNLSKDPKPYDDYWSYEDDNYSLKIFSDEGENEWYFSEESFEGYSYSFVEFNTKNGETTISKLIQPPYVFYDVTFNNAFNNEKWNKIESEEIESSEEWFGPIKSGRLDLIIDSNGDVRGHTVRIYQDIHREEEENNKESSVLFDKNSFKIEKGDTITFYAETVTDAVTDEGNDKFSYDSTFLNSIKFKQDPKFEIKAASPKSGEDFYVAMRAKDLKGNQVQTKFFRVPSTLDNTSKPEPPSEEINLQDDGKPCAPNC